MMVKKAVALPLLFLAVSLAAFGSGEHGDSHHGPASAEPEIQLSPPLQQALGREMLSIQNAMMDLVPSISAGDWPEVAKLAKQIEGSYIMKQELSAEQMEELHHALPAGFQERDGSFHRMAGLLAHVAEAGHVELVSFYFYKLNEGCVSCHSRYARHRFPAFSGEPLQHEHQH